MVKKRRKAMPKISRFDKARNLVELNAVKSLKTDKSGRIINALVPGSQAKTYEVIARREGRNYIEIECLLQTGAGGQDCKGGWSAVCYHALAVLLTSARENGLDAAICHTLPDAKRRENLNGKTFMLKSKHAPDNPLWLVVNRIKNIGGLKPDKIIIDEAKKISDSTSSKLHKTTDEINKELGY